MAMTSERAREVALQRKLTGRVGGRPRGSLAPATIAKINNKKAMQEAIQKRAGRIVSNLLVGSDLLDTTASKELLERGFGKVSQDINITGDISLKALHLTALPPVAGQVVAANIAAQSIVPLLEEEE